MKLAIVLAFDEGFLPGAETLLYSLRKHNSLPVGTEIVLIAERDMDIGEHRFIEIPVGRYSATMLWMMEIYKKTLFGQYDRLIFTDVDTLVVDDISYLWSEALYEKDFWAVSEDGEYIFAGLVVLNKSFWERAHCPYRRMRKMIRAMNDQNALNMFLKESPEVKRGFLPSEYVGVIYRLRHKENWRHGARILHFAGRPEPWTEPGHRRRRRRLHFQPAVDLWRQYYGEAKLGRTVFG